MLSKEQVELFKSKLVDRLAEEGFRPKVNDYGDIEFKVEGRCHFIDFDSNDPAYVRLLLPNFWSIDNATERHAAFEAASKASSRCKGVKVFVEGDSNVWASVEFLIPDPALPTVEMLERYLQMIEAGTREFKARIRELQASSPISAGSVLTH